MRAEAHVHLGMLWEIKQRWEQALTQYEAAIAADPGHLPAWLHLGELLTDLQRFDKADEVYREARRFHPHTVVLDRFIPQIKTSAAASQPVPQNGPHLLLYTDCAGRYGSGEINHALACGLHMAGFRVQIAQVIGGDPRVGEREALGIVHRPLRPDSIYQAAERRALVDATEVEALLEHDPPQAMLFADGCPLSNLAAREAAVRRGVAAVSIVHAVADEWALEFASYLPRLAKLYAQQHEVVAVSQHGLVHLRTSFGLGPAKGRVILNGRPEAWFAEVDERARERIRSELEVPAGSLLVLTTASLESRKGYQYQVQALGLLARRCPDLPLHLMWAGGGTQKKQLRANVARSPFPVHFLGERGDVPDLLDACDGVVLTSEYEGMPLAVMEAMARGRPVAATAVSGIPEALGPTGRLLPDPRQDPHATAAALADVLIAWHGDPVGRSETGAAGRERARRLFREARMVEEYVHLLRPLMG